MLLLWPGQSGFLKRILTKEATKESRIDKISLKFPLQENINFRCLTNYLEIFLSGCEDSFFLENIFFNVTLS